jgi:hypothetical protein
MELITSVPLVSFLIPLHRPLIHHLEELLKSLPLDQPELEFVVGINPHASFTLQPWLKQWQLGAYWQIFEHQKILSVNAHYHFLQQRARGIWLAPVDQDDRWQYGRWQSLLSQIQKLRDDKPSLLASSPNLCNENLDISVNNNSRFLLEPLIQTPTLFRWFRVLCMNPVPGCCCIYSRSLLQLLGWPPAQPTTPFYDHQLIVRTLLSPRCRLVVLNGPRVDWRRHQGCVSGRRSTWFRIFIDRLRLLSVCFPRFGM